MASKHVDAHQAAVKLFLEFAQMTRCTVLPFTWWRPSPNKVVILGVFNQIIVVAGDVFGAGE
jgi:hypothetical protein